MNQANKDAASERLDGSGSGVAQGFGTKPGNRTVSDLEADSEDLPGALQCARLSWQWWQMPNCASRKHPRTNTGLRTKASKETDTDSDPDHSLLLGTVIEPLRSVARVPLGKPDKNDNGCRRT